MSNSLFMQVDSEIFLQSVFNVGINNLYTIYTRVCGPSIGNRMIDSTTTSQANKVLAWHMLNI